MWPRLLFWLITAFFITMNVLLWRSEFGGRSGSGSTVPLETVWHKMLIAPDNSRLEIRHHGKKIGYATWQPAVLGREEQEQRQPSAHVPECQILDLVFSQLMGEEVGHRKRFIQSHYDKVRNLDI